MRKLSKELRKYIGLQIVDYVSEQAGDGYITSSTTKKIRSGIENICISVFGKEYAPQIRRDSSRLLRACLNSRQLGITSKFLKFLDSKNTSSTNIISKIIGEIAHSSTTGEYKNEQNMIKRSWHEKLKSEPNSKSLEKV